MVKTKLANTASIVVALLIGGIFYNLHFNWIHLAIGLILIIMSVHYIPKLMEITPTTSGTLSKPSRIILFSCFIVCSYYFSQLDSYLEPPTIVFAELRSNDVMQVVNKAYCGWGFFNNARNGTQDSFGWREPARGVSARVLPLIE